MCPFLLLEGKHEPDRDWISDHRRQQGGRRTLLSSWAVRQQTVRAPPARLAGPEDPVVRASADSSAAAPAWCTRARAPCAMLALPHRAQTSVTLTRRLPCAPTPRLQTELMTLMTAGDPSLSAFPEGDNIFQWTGTITGGAGTVCCAERCFGSAHRGRRRGLYRLLSPFWLPLPLLPPLLAAAAAAAAAAATRVRHGGDDDGRTSTAHHAYCGRRRCDAHAVRAGAM